MLVGGTVSIVQISVLVKKNVRKGVFFEWWVVWVGYQRIGTINWTERPGVGVGEGLDPPTGSQGSTAVKMTVGSRYPDAPISLHRKETDCHASLKLARNHHAFSHRYKRKDYQCQVSFRARKGVGISRIALHFL